MTEWHKVSDSRTERPAPLDTTSSAAVVYERRNIERVTREVDVGGKPQEIQEWTYEQREYTVEEYATMVSPANQNIMQAISGLEATMAEIQLGQL